MLRSLESGVSAMQSFQQEMDVIGNNIANANTTGYKSSRILFDDSFSQTLRGAQSASGSSSAVPSLQIGTGVVTAGIQNNFTQGTIARTNTTGGRADDLYVEGPGFFIVKDPRTNQLFATRDGQFTVDTQGFMTTLNGLRLQGYSDAAATTAPDAVNKATVGDMKIDSADRSTEFPSKYNIDSEGKIHVTAPGTNTTPFIRGQVLLQTFGSPNMLVKEGGNLYSGLLGAAPANGIEAPSGEPGAKNVGQIEAGALELSNVDLATEFASLIRTQRSFQASSRIITTSDEMLQETVNLKR